MNSASAAGIAAAGGELLMLAEDPLTSDELGDARGGFSAGGMNFSFGVTIAPVAPVNVAPVAGVAPVNVAPVAGVAPVNVAPVAPVNVAPVADVAPVSVAPVADVAPVNVAPVAPVNIAPVAPVNIAPVADVAPVNVAPVAGVAPVNVAPVAPVNIAPVADVAPVVIAPVAGVAPVVIAPVAPVNIAPVAPVNAAPPAAPAQTIQPTIVVATTSLVPLDNPAAASPIASATFSNTQGVPIEAVSINPTSTSFVINNAVDGAIIRQQITIDVEISNFTSALSLASTGAQVSRITSDAAFLGSLN